MTNAEYKERYLALEKACPRGQDYPTMALYSLAVAEWRDAFKALRKEREAES